MGNKQSFAAMENDVNIGHFKLQQVIGKGAFGVVRVVQKRNSTKKKYALKYMSKEKIIKKKMIKNVLRERLILEEADHPFIINLQYAFQDDRHLFFVLDLALGGDLRFTLVRTGCLSLHSTRVYAAELCSAISYLHSFEILHRDLKPENLLIDEQGHIHITDFNVAILLSEKIPSSKSGTTAYMAPEQFISKPYTYSVDWWALGVVLYECTFGSHPFVSNKSQPLEILICERPISFQTPPKHKQQHYRYKNCPERLDFIAKLLEKAADKRLGSNGFPAIANHPWFQGLDWSLVDKKGLTPDFLPDPTQNNYDFGAALEELLYESTPLPTKPVLKRKQRKERPMPAMPSISFLWNDENTSNMESELDYLDQYFPSYSKATHISAKNESAMKTAIPGTGSLKRFASSHSVASSDLNTIVFQDRKSSLALKKLDVGSHQLTKC